MESSPSVSSGSTPAIEPFSDLLQIIEHVAHLLPAQGPIQVFVHHNTLHPFEDLPFDEALRLGGRTYGCQTYLSELRYREELSRGRMTLTDLAAVLLDDLGDEADRLIGVLGTRFHLRLAMLEHPLPMPPDPELRWLMADKEALSRFRPEVPLPVRSRMVEETRRWIMRDIRNGNRVEPADGQRRARTALHDLLIKFHVETIERWSDETWEAFCLHALWRACHQGVHGVPWPEGPYAPPSRPRDLLLATTGTDCDLPVHELLVQFCGAFLDQGVAGWSLPYREAGFYAAFLALYAQHGGPPVPWRRTLRTDLRRLQREQVSPLASIEESLEILGIEPHEREVFLTETLLALRGWAGMIWQMETNAEWTIRPAPSGSLIEFLAIRLLLDRHALSDTLRNSVGWSGSIAAWRRSVSGSRRLRPETFSVDQRTFLVFQLAQVRGWKPEDLFRMTKAEWARLVEELEAFSSTERRRIYQKAFERRYRNLAFDAIALHSRRPHDVAGTPDFQLITCIDDREESFRRHLEELAPNCETLAVAGFFSAAIYYRGAADAHFIPLCPVVIKPQHYVQEQVTDQFEGTHQRRTRTRRLIGTASHWFHTGSRSFLGGVATALVGSLASIPLVARILFPLATARLRKQFGSFVELPPVTQLVLERKAAQPGPEPDGLGFTVPEMADIVARTLQDLGLTRRFARLVIFAGHGSSSLNNPHESAYNCGACGGGRGGPNARAFATMANDPRVRELLVERGLHLPTDVVFVGAFHNTCDDSVTYFDLDRLPATHRGDFDSTRRIIDRARERNAHERARRFESAPLSLSPEAALRHVEERSEDLSQARPEYNHATNALCIVGRRLRTRGLFLDRRAFLASYDPTQDDAEQTILARILAAVIPVCAGISLEYYFSAVDIGGFGCGSKLPHNIAALLGVMEGAAGDLRTGLSAQMTEIHEPLRLVFLIETTGAAMLSIMDRNPAIGRLCRNDWVQLAVLDPNSSEIQVFQDGRFVHYDPETRGLPQVAQSADWYRGWRDFLGFAVIGEPAVEVQTEARSSR